VLLDSPSESETLSALTCKGDGSHCAHPGSRLKRGVMGQHSPPLSSERPPGNWNGRKEAVLSRAVEKLVASGAQAGVSAEDMIGLLDSGMSVAELLAYVFARFSGQVE